jgi:hypothetical protein
MSQVPAWRACCRRNEHHCISCLALDNQLGLMLHAAITTDGNCKTPNFLSSTSCNIMVTNANSIGHIWSPVLRLYDNLLHLLIFAAQIYNNEVYCSLQWPNCLMYQFIHGRHHAIIKHTIFKGLFKIETKFKNHYCLRLSQTLI